MLRDVKILFFIYQIYKYFFYIPLLAFVTFIGTVFIVALSPFLREKPGQVIGKLWARINAYATPMAVETSGFENIDTGQSYIIVANHQSLFDIFVLYGWLPVEFRWVMKAELRKVPFLGYFCYVAGHVFVNRKDRKEALEAINSAKSRIKDGVSIVFFPEGTRSNDGKLIPFKKGAYHFAMDMGLPILPVTIDGTRNILPNNTIALFPGKTRLVIHKPISIENHSEKTIDTLIEQSQEAITAGLT